jgi:MFS family permease
VGDRGARPSLVLAGVALIAGALLLTGLQAHTATIYVLGAYALFGLGQGMVNPPITNTAVSGMPPAQAGVAAAIASTSRQVGMTLGVAIAGAIVGSGLTSPARLAHGFIAAARPAWWIMVALSGAVLVVGALTTTRWAERTARRTARRLGGEARGLSRDLPAEAFAR